MSTRNGPVPTEQGYYFASMANRTDSRKCSWTYIVFVYGKPPFMSYTARELTPNGVGGGDKFVIGKATWSEKIDLVIP